MAYMAVQRHRVITYLVDHIPLAITLGVDHNPKAIIGQMVAYIPLATKQVAESIPFITTIAAVVTFVEEHPTLGLRQQQARLRI